MSDIGLTWNSSLGGADFSVSSNDLEVDDGLETSVELSLFTDREDPGNPDRRGWWGDLVPTVEGDKIGSRLWLLARVKQLPTVPTLAKQYAEEALQWLLDDKVAVKVEVESGIVAKGILGLTVAVYRPNGDSVRYRWNYTWAAQERKRV